MSAEKDRRKQLKQDYKKDEYSYKVASIPIDKSDLAALFDFLDEKLSADSGGDYRFTIEFLQNKNLPVEPTVTWLQQYGGHNDAEVLWNVEQEFEDILN